MVEKRTKWIRLGAKSLMHEPCRLLRRGNEWPLHRPLSYLKHLPIGTSTLVQSHMS